MRLFSKSKAAPAPEITYDEVVDYLRDLAQTDYTKIIKVVGIYRDADKSVKKVLNIQDVPTDVNHIEPLSLLEDDDTELGNFLDDNQDTPASKKQRKTAQKATNIAKKITVKQ